MCLGVVDKQWRSEIELGETWPDNNQAAGPFLLFFPWIVLRRFFEDTEVCVICTATCPTLALVSKSPPLIIDRHHFEAITRNSPRQSTSTTCRAPPRLPAALYIWSAFYAVTVSPKQNQKQKLRSRCLHYTPVHTRTEKTQRSPRRRQRRGTHLYASPATPRSAGRTLSPRMFPGRTPRG